MTDSAPPVQKTQPAEHDRFAEPPAERSETQPRPPQTLHDVEARHIADVLSLTDGKIGEAAKILGIHRNTLARKIRRYGL